MKRRLLVLVIGCAFAAATIATTAAADPIKAKGALQFQVVCGSQTLTVVVNGNGEFTPGHIVGSTAVFIPTSFDITFTFTPTGGATMTETDTAAKAALTFSVGTILPATSSHNFNPSRYCFA